MKKTDIGTIYRSYSDFLFHLYSSVGVCVHVCEVLYNFIISCVGSCIHHHSQNTE